MLFQVATLGECLAACGTLERLLARMDPFVPLQITALRKGLVAPAARKRPIGCVSASMLLQVA